MIRLGFSLVVRILEESIQILVIKVNQILDWVVVKVNQSLNLGEVVKQNLVVIIIQMFAK